jgi:hypothetical protein
MHVLFDQLGNIFLQVESLWTLGKCPWQVEKPVGRHEVPESLVRYPYCSFIVRFLLRIRAFDSTSKLGSDFIPANCSCLLPTD